MGFNLVGGIPTPLKKYDFVNWHDDCSQLNGKGTFMFQTTNQPYVSMLTWSKLGNLEMIYEIWRVSEHVSGFLDN